MFDAGIAGDAIIITRDRGFVIESSWPPDFTAGVIFVNLPDNFSAEEINSKIIALLSRRIPESLLGAVTVVETKRALSRMVRRRS